MIPSDKTILMQSGLSKWLNLLFFVLVLTACNNHASEIRIIWAGEQARGITIPEKEVTGISKDSIHIRLLSDSSSSNILGDFKNKDGLVFEPVIPFTRGMTYGVFAADKKISSITIPFADENDAPKVITVYPLQDTLPENLLKMYIQFSKPMKEGLSAENVLLIKNNKDTLRDVFLNLQPELWNEDRTVLTIWLDPGRIKRDLQPNLKLGNPLQKNEKYELIISQNWRNVHGQKLKKDHSKTFIVSSRDSLSPITEQWKIHPPKNSSKELLTVELNEAPDHFLLMECLSIRNSKGLPVKGKFEITDNDMRFHFTPTDLWARGNYSIRILSKLEDLAGNNLNKVFDRDTKTSKQPGTKEYYEKGFTIQ